MCHIYQMMWRKYQEHTPEILIGLLFSVLLAMTLIYPSNTAGNLLERAEMALYDLRIRLGENFTPTENAPPIIIIDIDERSQVQEGRWPWPRDRVADLINKIGAQEPALIVLDILFGSTEPVPQTATPASCTADLCSIPLRATASSTDADRQLAAAIARHDVVAGFLFHEEYLINGKLPDSRKHVPENILPAWEPTGHSTSLPLIQHAAKAQGYMNTLLAGDGTARRLPLFMQYDGYLYPSLALAAAQRYLLEDDWQAQIARIGEQKLYAGLGLSGQFIPTDMFGNILIPYSTRSLHFPAIAATDIMRGNTPGNTLEGAIVMIGTSALLLGDLKPTPVKADLPGVAIQAYTLQGLLHPEILLSEPAWGLTIELIGMVALALLMLVLYPLCGPRTLLLTGITLLLIASGANLWMWHGEHIRLDLIPTLLLIMFITGLFVVYDMLRENRERHHLQRLFGQYVPPEHIQQIMATPESVNLAGEKREMTVLFADLHDFTSLAERLDTQTLKNLLNRYLNAATAIIFEYSGTIDKYIGDMVMAFWNAPLREPDHARQAVLSALGLRKMLRDNAAEYREFGITPLQLGIGINTGEMNVGDMGSSYRRAYTVLGDAVNLAARIETLTRFYGVDILVSEHTRKQCQGIIFRSVDRVRVKGKREAVLLLHPLGLHSELSPQALRAWKMHETAMDHYWKRDWQHASKLFAHILIESPDDPLAGMYLQRIATLTQKTPPPDWDGVYEHRRK